MTALNYQFSLFSDSERVNIVQATQNVVFHWNFTSPVKLKALKEIRDAINKFKRLGTIDY